MDAEDFNYWRTSRSDADTWLEKAERVVEGYGAVVTHRARLNWSSIASRPCSRNIDGESYRLAWPVLESRSGDERSDRRQAATMLYHEAKARALRRGLRRAAGLSRRAAAQRRADGRPAGGR